MAEPENPEEEEQDDAPIESDMPKRTAPKGKKAGGFGNLKPKQSSTQQDGNQPRQYFDSADYYANKDPKKGK
ncbi:MAG: hypothetical protein EZS28_031162 [Streblomastix strix]|uniref:Uncharacterized protein n=1 Tax=Streblomastix strix TaxID=222440 RepID=A0A5J4UT95_9EUKA|nr:MAG: hypothetical protein EZS28_031162 [Streblomastix strix]